MKTINYTVNGIGFSVSADESIISLAQILFRAIVRIPVERIKDGYKFEMGFSVFICAATDTGFKIVVPDYLSSPFSNTAEDLTVALWILLEQTEMLKGYGIEGVPTRFDDEIVVAKNALESPAISLQRYSDLGKEASGWCIEALKEKADGTYQMVQAEGYESIYAYQLLQKRSSLLKVLVLPYEYVVVVMGDEIVEILNENDESLME